MLKNQKPVFRPITQEPNTGKKIGVTEQKRRENKNKSEIRIKMIVSDRIKLYVLLNLRAAELLCR